MRKIKIIFQDDDNLIRHNLIYGKIYDVIRYLPDYYSTQDNIIIIIDERGSEKYFSFFEQGITFENVTTEYRNSIIEEILE